MAKIKPLNGTIAIQRIESSEQSYGNIVIPDMGKERPEMGVVIAISDTYNWHKGEVVPSKLSIGQTVMIPKMGASTFSVDMEEYILVRETDILCVLEF